MKGPSWKTLTTTSHFAHSSLEECSRELERVFFKNPRTLLSEIEFWLPSLDQDLASTGTSSKIVALKVIGSTLRVDTVRGELRSWFASVFVALTSRSVFETDTR